MIAMKKEWGAIIKMTTSLTPHVLPVYTVPKFKEQIFDKIGKNSVLWGT